MAATIYYCLTATAPVQSTERLLGGGSAQLKRPRALGVALAPEEDARMRGLDVFPQAPPQTMGEFARRLFPDLPSPVPAPSAPVRSRGPWPGFWQRLLAMLRGR